MFDIGVLRGFAVDVDAADDEEEEVKNPAWISGRVSAVVRIVAESVEAEEDVRMIVGDVGLA